MLDAPKQVGAVSVDAGCDFTAILLRFCCCLRNVPYFLPQAGIASLLTEIINQARAG
jgi:hypothetical protein